MVHDQGFGEGELSTPTPSPGNNANDCLIPLNLQLDAPNASSVMWTTNNTYCDVHFLTHMYTVGL